MRLSHGLYGSRGIHHHIMKVERMEFCFALSMTSKQSLWPQMDRNVEPAACQFQFTMNTALLSCSSPSGLLSLRWSEFSRTHPCCNLVQSLYLNSIVNFSID